MSVSSNPEDILDTALYALGNAPEWRAVLDELPAPIYTTDAEGAVTYWNRACVELAGREPQLGRDRWCVTWKLFTTTGEPMPHDQCPMADAIREQRVIRDTIAIAERPDGSRRAFTPYPTPLFDDDGVLSGAVNLLVDVTAEQAGELRGQAEHCRRLAKGITDASASRVLEDMAIGYECTAARLAKG